MVSSHICKRLLHKLLCNGYEIKCTLRTFMNGLAVTPEYSIMLAYVIHENMRVNCKESSANQRKKQIQENCEKYLLTFSYLWSF